MKPLIVHIRASNFYGGPERQIIGHVQSSSQFHHLVVTFQEGSSENELQKACLERNIDVDVIKTKHAYQWSSVQQLRACFLKRKPAVVCCHGYKPLILNLLAQQKSKIPTIAFSRGHTSENFKIRCFEYIERKLYNYTDKIVAVSQGYADQLIQHGIARTQIEVVLNAVQLEQFLPLVAKKKEVRESLGFGEHDFLIATAGRLSPEKAQRDLLAAFSILCQAYEKAHLVICGNGPLRSTLERQAAAMNCQRVHFLGHRKDLDSLMPVFNLFVLPSYTEGLPNVLLEAAACHVPIVATRVGGVPEIITEGESGFLVDPGNTKQLSAAIEQFLCNEQLAGHLVNNAYQVLVRKYSFTEQARKLENLYRNTMLSQ